MRLYKWLFFLISIALLAVWARYDLTFLSGFWDGFIGGLLFAGVLGVATLEIGRYWTIRREPDMEPPPGETLRKKDVASWLQGAEVVRGKLFLTDRALYFRARSRSRKPLAFDIPLKSLREVAWYNHRRIFPFGLALHTTYGATYALLLDDRRAWREAILEV